MDAFKILYDREGEDYKYVLCGAESRLQSEAESNFPFPYFETPFCQWRVGELDLVSDPFLLFRFPFYLLRFVYLLYSHGAFLLLSTCCPQGPFTTFKLLGLHCWQI